MDIYFLYFFVTSEDQKISKWSKSQKIIKKINEKSTKLVKNENVKILSHKILLYKDIFVQVFTKMEGKKSFALPKLGEKTIPPVNLGVYIGG